MNNIEQDATLLNATAMKILVGGNKPNLASINKVLPWDNERMRLAAEALMYRTDDKYLITILNDLNKKGEPTLAEIGFVERPE